MAISVRDELIIKLQVTLNAERSFSKEKIQLYDAKVSDLEAVLSTIKHDLNVEKTLRHELEEKLFHKEELLKQCQELNNSNEYVQGQLHALMEAQNRLFASQ